MKSKFTLVFLMILFLTPKIFSQKLNFGIENGINFSKVNKSDFYQPTSQPGPVNGIFASYELGNWFIVQSGVNHATFYFDQNSLNNYSSGNHVFSHSSTFNPFLKSSSFAALTFSSTSQSGQLKYSFLRFPLFLKFKTPGRLNFEIGGGAYFALLTNDEFRGKDKDFNEGYGPPLNDWGWILASSVKYGINESWNLFATGQITSGQNEYFDYSEDVGGKIGSTELTFGIGYKPFNSDKYIHKTDSLSQSIKILPHTGVNISNVRSSENKNEYKPSTGLSTGVTMCFILDPKVSFLTGAWYERKGYGLNYTGNYSFIYLPPSESNTLNITEIQSEVKLDYVTFPFMLEISFGRKIQSNINFGGYYSWLQNAFAQGEQIVTYNYDYGYNKTKSSINQRLDHWFKKSDVGFLVGYRIDIPLFKWCDVFIYANQSIGAKSIFNNQEELSNASQPKIEEELHTNSTSILFGLTIPLFQK